MHEQSHPRRGETVHLMVGTKLYDFEVEDWWVRAGAHRRRVHGRCVPVVSADGHLVRSQPLRGGAPVSGVERTA